MRDLVVSHLRKCLKYDEKITSGHVDRSSYFSSDATKNVNKTDLHYVLLIGIPGSLSNSIKKEQMYNISIVVKSLFKYVIRILFGKISQSSFQIRPLM